MSELRKRISIASTAPLTTYGGIMGPIRTPFYETISNISLLISGGAEVYEHIGDKKIRLDMVNFDVDNGSVETEVSNAKAADEPTSGEADSIIRISGNHNKNQNQKGKQKEKFYNEKVQPQVAKTVVDPIVEE